MTRDHSNTCDLVGFRQGYNAPPVCSCGADSSDAVLRSAPALTQGEQDLGGHVPHGGRGDLGPADRPELPHDAK